MFIALLLPTLGRGETEGKPAFVDAQNVLENTKEGARLRQILDEFVRARQQIIDLDEQEIKRLKDDIDKQGAILSQEALKMKQGEFDRVVNQYRNKVNELQKEVQDKRVSALNEFNQKLEQVVKQIAEKEGYAFVLDKNGERGSVLYAKPTHDITAKVIAQMDKLFASQNPAPAAPPATPAPSEKRD